MRCAGYSGSGHEQGCSDSHVKIDAPRTVAMMKKTSQTVRRTKEGHDHAPMPRPMAMAWPAVDRCTFSAFANRTV